MRRPWMRWMPIAVSVWSGLALGIGAAPAASGQARNKASPRPAPIASCIGAGPRLPMRAGEPRTLLEDDDRVRVHAAIVTRHPVLRDQQPAPRHIMLWRKGRDEWLYVNLADRPLDKPADGAPGAPAGLCFTATVLATDFEFTQALIQKYFFPGAAPA